MDIFDRNHPSFGTDQAVFMFALTDTTTGVMNRFLLIEVTNPHAVITLERLVHQDGKVADNCALVAVFRNNQSVGIRHELLEEVPYVDFMLDIVSIERILNDAVVSTTFKQSLTQEEANYASRKLRDNSFVAVKPIPDNAIMIREDQPTVVEPVHKYDNKGRLEFALRTMGLDKKAIRAHIQTLGNVEYEPLEDLIYAAIMKINFNRGPDVSTC